jgi:demethylmenaquinone methyltransferase/2-methoxy-6-polyprenyl-1,4-benzoquinol methylase
VSGSSTEIARVTRSRKEAQAAYDQLSRWYDVLAGSSERGLVDLALQKLAVREGESVLEVGFGTGHGILSLAQAVGPKGRVCGVDVSSGMLGVTRAKVGQAALSDSVRLCRGDAVHLPLAPRSFDAIFMSFTLELFDTPEIPMVLRECQRVLRADGRICVAAMSKEGETGLMGRLYEWAHRTFPRYVDCRPIHLRRALQEADLRVVDETEMSMWGLPVAIVVAKKAALEL